MQLPSSLENFKGNWYTDKTTRRLYATDASAYREIPMAVAIPSDDEDIKTLIKFAQSKRVSLIPRTAGTSLAGQVVGTGIVVDFSSSFQKILEINQEEKWAWVQPGIVRDDLNRQLKHLGLFFAPETSTANRAMIGGMIGNNSCGSNSVVYGSTREHLLAVKTLLSDGSLVEFQEESIDEFLENCLGRNSSSELKTEIYQKVKEILEDPVNQKEIREGYPDPKIPRRNTGYALDLLLAQQPFSSQGPPFNLASLVAGSEGTLAIVTAAKIRLTPLPASHQRIICIHCDSIDESLRSNLVALKFQPSACELIDHYILEATERSILYQPYRSFVEGKPQALLVVEIIRDSSSEVDSSVTALIQKLKESNLGYAYPVLSGEEATKVWSLRKAGLGLLSNIPGDAKPVPVIEDTAVKVEELPAYIAEFNELLSKYGLYSVHYAHAGSGEIHLRPILNLKTSEGIALFRQVAEDISKLVKKYKGSLSGEHGDGRLRGEFIPFMLGKHNYELCKEIKKAWDPNNIFNPGKIIDSPPMDAALRFEAGQKTPDYTTKFDFSENEGIVRAAEQCNGSGDCRKSYASGGTMCPSYMATRNEKDTTRARANILREMLSKEEKPGFHHPEIKEVMELCLSCKGCKSECPSNVDMAKLKAEWQYQSYKTKSPGVVTTLFANYTAAIKIAAIWPSAYSWLMNDGFLSILVKKIMGVAPKRSMPDVAKQTLRNWVKREYTPSSLKSKKGSLYLFIDEFSEYLDVQIGQSVILLLDKLGYEIRIIEHKESGRSLISKGFLDQAASLAEQNISLFYPLVSKDCPLVGIEPSAILSFRDEYPSLVRGELQEKAKKLAKNALTFEEFIAKEMQAGNIHADQFTNERRSIKYHGHCHQKALSSMTPTRKILGLPRNYSVSMIPSGCCGMAGSFGYDIKNYEISMSIGDMVLFPSIRTSDKDELIVAAGTSCRHQIIDGTQRKSFHPAEILWEALLEK